ncbi:MAG: hypothetical protein EBQ92_12830 [Proteobacteria bacterium]|nr:hypothetical protein [Pseudomonadota bacterium]
MKKWLLGLVVLQAVSGAAEIELFRDDEGISHRVEEIETATPVKEGVKTLMARRAEPRSSNENAGGLLEELDLAAVVLDKVVNLGKKMWTVVENGRPVVNVKTAYANALPSGVRAEDLENFSSLQFRSFRHYGVNLYGITVYDITYTLAHRFGGQFNGQGAYIESATVLPQNVEVLWGYNVNLNVEQVSAVNLGTKENPIASLAMETGLIVKTVMKEVRIKHLHEFRGDSAAVRSTELN